MTYRGRSRKSMTYQMERRGEEVLSVEQILQMRNHKRMNKC